MKKVLLSLMFVGLTLTAFCQKKETRAVSNFTGIDASSVFDITVTKGNAESLTIEADDAVMPYVRSEVKDGVLNLYIDKDGKTEQIKTLKASIVMKNLEKVSLSGACKLSSKDLFTPDNFKSDCSGASSLTLSLKTGQLTAGSSGASKISLNAEAANTTKFNLSGSSKINVELKAADVQFNNSGVSSVELNGSASSIKIGTSGTSKIKAENFMVKSATIESSGSSNITLYVTETLKVNSSGASTIKYKGSPVVDAKNGGASTVKKL